jgi:hypothetical protein
MSGTPRLEPRRASDFTRELLARARTWLPQWKLAPDGQDPGRALLEVAARLSAEVAERLDQVAEKNRRNLALWLGIRGAAARGARVPVAFKLTDSARRAVLARTPVRMQADAGGATLVFESEQDVLLVPARIAQVVAVDAARDAYFLPPPGLSSLDPLPPDPTQWRVRSFAAAGSSRLQLDPSLGLAQGLILEIDQRQYRVTKVDDDIVTIDPAVDAAAGIAQDALARQLIAFEPFAPNARNRQNHALYLGHTDLLNVEAAALIEVVNGEQLASGFSWQYWGKLGDADAAWNPLDVAAKQDRRDALRLEKKAIGALEPREIAGVKARWIRAVVPSLAGSQGPLSLGDLRLTIGSMDEARPPRCEGLVNTTPLVLDDTFLPLGREPRQFDAFYLGCSEVFSKRRAQVTLGVRLADTTFRSLVNVGPARLADAMLAGVARDGSLHLIALSALAGSLTTPLERASLQPPSAVDPTRRTALDAELPWRLPAWTSAGYYVLAVSSGANVWVYFELTSTPFFGDWIALGSVAANPVADMKIDGLVFIGASGTLQLFALYNGQLSERSAFGTGTWNPVATEEGGVPVRLKAIAPVAAAPGVVPPAGAAVMVGVSDAGELYEVLADGTCTALPTILTLATDIQPAAVRLSAAEVLVFAAATDRVRIVAYSTLSGEDDIGLASAEKVLGLAIDLDPTTRTVLASVGDATNSRLIWWTPFGTSTTAELLDAPLDPESGQLAGTPTRLDGFAIVPGSRSNVHLLPIQPAALTGGSAPLEHWLVQPTAVAALTVGDRVNARTGHGGVARVTAAPIVVAGERYTPLATESVDASYPAELLRFETSTAGASTTLLSTNATESELQLAVPTSLDGVEICMINDGSFRLFAVDPVVPGTGPGGTTVATVRPGLTAFALNDPVEVWPAAGLDGAIDPVLRLDAAATPPNIAASAVESNSIILAGAVPPRRRGTVVTRGLGSTAAAVALDGPFTTPPTPDAAGEVRFTINGAPGAWKQQLGDTSSNPELSWEYSDGKSWRILPNLIDRTRHLKASDTVSFEVPDDLVESDWAGRSNYWIRARLVGGDYGREILTVNSTASGATTTQSVERSTTGIKAPAVVSLEVRYELKTAILPEAVLAEDAGGFRDQSDANRTPGAEVEAFVPLAVMLGRLDDRGTTAAQPGQDPTSCCRDVAPESTPAQAGAAAGRAVLIGIDGTVQGEPINLLLAVGTERPHDAAAPLRVDALVAGRFEPIAATDGTRAIGESGLVTVSLPVAPTRTALFGQSLSWLRLSPSNALAWEPSIASAVLNAAWATAAETQTLEVLGSSAGEPDMQLVIARPPLLRDSLELRIREALTDEEVEELRRNDSARVLSDVEGLPGHWVRWDQVGDPADSAAGERVYSLDEATGTVGFGNGRNGMIPPIGRDHIVAFRYRRVEPLADTAGTAPAVSARGTLGLVTPLEGVEAVMAALDAGRGAPPDDNERILRFAPAQLRHRGRALTARDIEDIVLQAQPAVAQARCLLDGTTARLIVVMRGTDPTPSRAMVRELTAVLSAALPPTLTGRLAPGIAGPVVRTFRVRATLRVPALETAGRVAQQARDALTRYFDPASGGDDGRGWLLGRTPSIDDAAARMIDIPGLDGIETLELFELAGGDERREVPALGADELARLAEDGTVFTYTLAEAAS